MKANSMSDDELYIPDNKPPTMPTSFEYGPFVLNGKLHFKFPNTSTVVCNCIRGHVAEEIGIMLTEWKARG